MRTFLWYVALSFAVLLGDAAGPHPAAARVNTPAAISTAQMTVNAILLGPEFSIFYSGFEN